ncbi:CCHC zinc finger protein [Haloferax tailed virus 1]|uniref:CCHC zinc finger protein n=1 Tax=Haloferax tailed virus 1 TaxID=2507575 RepID=A0A410N6R7_HFTV1|nr:CCHC zinc finger protein [Haloferax tailed virus 1]QAS68861.1 CCHC zinc finger protein [Haloferax tailed virus 1]
MNQNNISGESSNVSYEQQFEELDEKVVLVQILSELQAIRQLLTDAETDAQSDSSTEATYRCTLCPGDVTVPEAKREAHAQSEHNAPPGMELEMFEQG